MKYRGPQMRNKQFKKDNLWFCTAKMKILRNMKHGKRKEQ